MATIPDLLASFKDELAARYKSPFWGAALIILIGFHWKIVLFLILERPPAYDAISFVEANASASSIFGALAIAAIYIVVFPWLEFGIATAAAHGKRRRNDFQTREREQEIGRRKLIARQEAAAIEIELNNRENQAKLTDIELAKHYQGLLSGENFTRWLKDAQSGAFNSSLSNSIYSYLNKADTVEGRFFNPTIEIAHREFIGAISTLQSAYNDFRSSENDSKKSDITRFAKNALDAHQEYRSRVRELLNV